MSAVQFEDLIEVCLLRLDAGEKLEDVLNTYPDQSAELYPLLATGVDICQAACNIPVPAAAQTRSRAQFLTAAAGMYPAPRRFQLNRLHLRLATSTFIGIGILVAVLLGTGFASASALPGDMLYPVKILAEQVQMNIVQDPPARFELQENYDNRRQLEAERLSQMNRRQYVAFGGFLEKIDGAWYIGSVSLTFPDLLVQPTGLIGTYVEVSGYSVNNRVEVSNIEVRQMQWNGTLQKFDDQSWLISGLMLAVNPNTEMSGGQPRIGANVAVTAIRRADNQFLALKLAVAGDPGVSYATAVLSSLPPTPVPLSSTAEPEGDGSGDPGSQPVSQPASQATATPRAATLAPSQPAATRTVSGNNDEHKGENQSKATATAVSSKQASPSSTPRSTATTAATRTPTASNK
jgi:hypothetical protein